MEIHACSATSRRHMVVLPPDCLMLALNINAFAIIITFLIFNCEAYGIDSYGELPMWLKLCVIFFPAVV